MATINGIPSGKKTRKQLGRVGISKQLKRNDPEIDAILNAVDALEVHRGSVTVNAIPYLRAVRRACIAWMFANAPNVRAERIHIMWLLFVCEMRLTVVIEHNFAKSKAERAQHEARKNFSHVLDQIALRRAKGAGKALDGPYSSIERASRTHVGLLVGVRADTIYNREKMWTGLDFDDWIEQYLIPRSEDDPFNQYFNSHTVNSAELKSLMSQRVKYCDERERSGLIISLENGRFKNANGEFYHTGSKETGFNGDGWAIFVIDLEDRFYSESHILNEFHHSSFLSGAPVQSAGEIAVDRGRVVAITNKTGHYKAGPNELLRALEILEYGGVDLGTVAVNDPFRGGGRWFTGRAVSSANGNVAELPREIEIRKPQTVQQ